MFSGILNFVVDTCAIIAAIILVVYLVKDIAAYAQGGGGLVKILAKFGGVVLLIAIMFVSKSLTQKGQALSSGANGAVDQLINEVNGSVGG